MKEFFLKMIALLTHRMVVVFLFIVLAFSVLSVRLFQMQIINGKKFEEEFELKVLREVQITGRRGNIYDRNGFPLTENKIAYSVTYDTGIYTKDLLQDLLTFSRILIQHEDSLSVEFPIFLDENSQFRYKDELSPLQIERFRRDLEFDEEVISAYQAMETLQRRWFRNSYKDKEEYKRRFTAMSKKEQLYVITLRYAIWANGFYRFIPEKVAHNIKMETLADIQENKEKLIGFQIVEDYHRLYHYPEYFSHIIGYISLINEESFREYEEYGYSRDDMVGRIGIEKSMDLYLHGTKGSQIVEVDKMNRIKKVLATEEAKGGKNIFLTIDKDLQIETQNMLVKHLAELIQSRLVMRKTDTKDHTAPLLKEAYINLVENGTIRIGEILSMESTEADTASQSALKKSIFAYRAKRLERISKALEMSDIPANQDLNEFYQYFLETLVLDGYLSQDYKKTTGYEDFIKNAISFKGLLEFYMKEDFITEKEYQKITEELILKRYSANHTFDKRIILEMLDKELLSYLHLSVLLLEQNIVAVDEQTEKALRSGRMRPLDFMKKLISELKLMPAQVALDPCTGAAVVSDVKTSEVLAMVSYPSYDNNRLVNQFDNEYYRQLLSDKSHPLYPTATQGRTAPGSTMKVLSAIAGLEEGVITKNTLLSCSGIYTKLNPNIYCWIGAKGGSHGSIPLRRAIGVSCNSYFNEVGYRLATKNGTYDPEAGDEILRKYTKLFGLSTASGIELPEALPIAPGSLEDTSHIKNTATAAMGQEQNAYSAVHLARYMNTVGNRGTLNYLTLIHQINEADGSIYYKQTPKVELESDIPNETFDAVYEGMKDVNFSSYGTGLGVFQGFPIDVGGKTGTAQQIKTRPDHSVYVSIAPMSNPEISVVVVFPFGSPPYTHSSKLTTGLAKNIYRYFYELEKKHGDF